MPLPLVIRVLLWLPKYACCDVVAGSSPRLIGGNVSTMLWCSVERGDACSVLKHLGNTCQELGTECGDTQQLPQPRHDCVSHGMWLRASKSSAMGVLTGS